MPSKPHSGICLEFADSGTCTHGLDCKFKHIDDELGPAQWQRKSSISKSRPELSIQPPNASHLADFFSQYPEYTYDPFKPVMLQFYRLWNLFDWGNSENEEKKQAARDGLNTALVLQFNAIYGTNPNNIKLWRKLCEVVGMESGEIPNQIEACRKAVRAKHVNIVDLIDAGTVGGQVHVCKTADELANYTKTSGKYVPRTHPEAGELLLQITNPSRPAAVHLPNGQAGQKRRTRLRG